MSWTHLPNDVARCLGRRNFTAETETCPARSGCKRYLAAVEGRFGTDSSRSPWYMWMCETAEHEQRRPAEVAP